MRDSSNRMLTSSYHKEYNDLNKDCRVFRLNEYIPQLKELTPAQYLISALNLTSTLKAFSGTTLRTVKASPVQLRAIAESIENVPYWQGTNDSHTWFLWALSKLEHYQVGEKSLDEMARDTLTNAIAVRSKAYFECSSGGTNAVCEIVKTGKKLGARDGNAAEVVTTGSANTVNCLIKGVSRGTGAGVDAAGNAIVNAVGLITLGGCASKNPDNADFNSTIATHPVRAGVQRVGHAGGNIVYGVSGAAKSIVEGAGDITTTVVSGTAKVVGTSFAQVGKGFAAGFKSLGFGRRQ